MGLVVCGEELAFYFKGKMKPLEGIKQVSDMIEGKVL